MDFKRGRKETGVEDLFCKTNKLYHAIEMKNELNKKKGHLWEVPTFKKIIYIMLKIFKDILVM